MSEFIQVRYCRSRGGGSLYCILILLMLFITSVGRSQSFVAGKKLRVVLDPGHGGRDSVTKANGFYEKDVVLNIALEMKRQLESNNVEVVLTRNDDEFIALAERARIKGDLFVSLHANTVPDSIGPSVRSMIKGMEIYVDERMTDEFRLRKSKSFARVLHQNFSRLEGLAVRGNVRNRPLAVLKSNLSPAVLIELGYLTNFEDLVYLTTLSCYSELAAAFCKAIEAYQKLQI